MGPANQEWVHGAKNREIEDNSLIIGVVPIRETKRISAVQLSENVFWLRFIGNNQQRLQIPQRLLNGKNRNLLQIERNIATVKEIAACHGIVFLKLLQTPQIL
jgi:hypothetical protein